MKVQSIRKLDHKTDRGFSASETSLLLTYEKVLIVLQREILDRVSTDFLHSLQIVVVWRRKSALRIERE